ncbi:PAS/PAC sensor signal transduction histidine kinase [Streptohalobacillus salinus]|uniref:histidine kinase n=1 Tax=Streptohalobacillus salinus TaxID=621096 RepID=A0A2V3WHC1_9BACI|nr:ATP-binding protein [Streptohalobacillus salinus]PXW91705.1 PAS/PAC sensor signal transduction histidine kinase [Streptohalobacillus salinus]
MIWRGLVGKFWFYLFVLFIVISFGLFIVLRPVVKETLIDQQRAHLSETLLAFEGLSNDQTWLPVTLPGLIYVFREDQTDAVDLLHNTADLPPSVAGEQVTLVNIETRTGHLYASQPIAKVEARLVQYEQVYIITILLILGITALFAYVLSRRLNQRLMQIRTLALSYANADFSSKLIVDKNDDVAEVSLAFNRMGRQLKNQMDQLQREKQILYRIIGAMQEGVITVNLDGEILLVNQPGETLIRAMRYQNDSDSDEAIAPQRLLELFNPVMTHQETVMHNIHIHGRDYVLVATPLVGETVLQGVVSVVRDITEEKRLNELRESFIANVSHELRTPISLVQGYSEAIVDGVSTTVEDQQSLASIILDESLRMGRLVNDLLDLARIKSGQLELHLDEYPIEAFLIRVTRKFAKKASDKGLMIDYQVMDQALTQLTFDYDRLEQVLTNLIDNAIRHTESGKVTVQVKRVRDACQFDVIDTGTGIPADDLPFVFERFYKADKARTREKKNKKGTGLGLAIAKEIVYTHGGDISVHSNEGVGTTFSFTIPYKH